MHLILALLPFLSRRVLALTGAQIASHFHSTLSSGSGVYLSSDQEWLTETAQRWSQWSQPTFYVSVKPKLREDLQKVIQFSSRNNVSFMTTGGGHGYSGTPGALNGIQIDMGNFDQVSVDASKNLLTIGGSVRYRDVSPLVHAAGKATVVGACSCVGSVGATLGGGIGFYSGLYGAISDSLVSVEMIDGNGKLITASDSVNADLFWGMRGAGFNFGVITSLSYRIYDHVNEGNVMNADMLFPVSQNASVWEALKTYFENQAKELSLSTGLLFDPNSNQILIAVNAIYAGPQEAGTTAIQPLLSLSPLNLNITTLPWSAVSDAALYGGIAANCKVRPYYVPHAANLHTIDVANLIAVTNYMQETVPQNPALQSTLVTFTQYSAKGFAQYSENYSAFAHRRQTSFAQVDGISRSAADVPAVDAFGKRVRDMLRKGQDDTAVYVHFAHGDEGPRDWYTAEKLPRLRALKRKYDPRSLFSWYNPIS